MISEDETRAALVAYGAELMVTTLALATHKIQPLRPGHGLPVGWTELRVVQWKYEPPDDKGARAVLIELEDGRKYRLYAGVVPA